MVHASESQHWYTRNGAPAYEVKGANGSMRPATLRDARKLGLVPSVTSIIKCAAAPALERWKLDQMLHAALTLPRLDKEPEERWIERVWVDSKETAKKAAARGTMIHGAIQGHYEGKPPTEEMWPYVQGAKNAVNDYTVWGGDWRAERSFACHMGFGGKLDLSCPIWIIDFKTKEFYDGADLKTWDEHAMQLAAYRFGLGFHGARGGIVYVSTVKPGLAQFIEIPEDELRKGMSMFIGLLHYWQAKTGYASGWTEKAAA